MCLSCHAVFDEKDISHQREDTGEWFACCPVCGIPDLIDTETCEICGKDFEEGEIEYGVCLDCLWNAIDYDTALSYMKDRGELATFFMECIWQTGHLEHSSVEFDSFLEEAFKRKVANEKLMSQFVNFRGMKAEFLEQCRLFCLPYYYNRGFGPEGGAFAEWHKDHRKEAK